MCNQQLSTTYQQRDLGVIITKFFKLEKQTEKCCQTARRVYGFLALNFMLKNKEIIFKLYKSLVRPHLENSVQFSYPHLRQDIDEIEKDAAKTIPEIKTTATAYN